MGCCFKVKHVVVAVAVAVAVVVVVVLLLLKELGIPIFKNKQNDTCDVEGCVFEKTSTAQTHRHCQEFSLMKPIKGLCC